MALSSEELERDAIPEMGDSYGPTVRRSFLSTQSSKTLQPDTPSESETPRETREDHGRTRPSYSSRTLSSTFDNCSAWLAGEFASAVPTLRRTLPNGRVHYLIGPIVRVRAMRVELRSGDGAPVVESEDGDEGEGN